MIEKISAVTTAARTKFPYVKHTAKKSAAIAGVTGLSVLSGASGGPAY